MTRKWLVVLSVVYSLGSYARAVPDIHHARHKAAAADAPGPSWSGHHDVLFPSQTNEEKGESAGREAEVSKGDYKEEDEGDSNRVVVGGDAESDANISSKMVTGDVDANNTSTDLYSRDRNSEDGQEDRSGGKEVGDGNGESIIETLARHDAIKDMHQQADEMKMTAKEMEQSGKEQAKEAKAPLDVGGSSVGDGDSDSVASSSSAPTTSTTIPKDSAGNIIITNKTVEGDSKKASGEPVDPLKALRSATESLYQRAQHKNLPVDRPGELTTPEQIYQALNRLEYIVDGFRHSQLESPNPDLNITEDVVGGGGGGATADGTDDAGSTDDTNNIDDGRFLQTRRRSKHKMEDDNDDDFDYGDEDEITGDEDDEMDSNKMDDDGGDEMDSADDEDRSGDGEDTDKMDDEPTKKKSKNMSSEEALEMLGSTITELVGILDQVVAANTGVKNVLVHQKGDPVQIK